MANKHFQQPTIVQDIFTSRSTSTPGAFKVITVNALYKLLTYLAYLSGVSIQRNVWNERKKVRNKRNERNSRKKRKLQQLDPSCPLSS